MRSTPALAKWVPKTCTLGTPPASDPLQDADMAMEDDREHSINERERNALHDDLQTSQLQVQENSTLDSAGKTAPFLEQTAERTNPAPAQSVGIYASSEFFMSPDGVAHNQPGPLAFQTLILASGKTLSQPRTPSSKVTTPVAADCPSAAPPLMSFKSIISNDCNNNSAKQSGATAKTQQSNTRIQEFIRRLQAISNRPNSSKEIIITPKSSDALPRSTEPTLASKSNKRKERNSTPTCSSSSDDKVKRRRQLIPSLDVRESPLLSTKDPPDSSHKSAAIRSSSAPQYMVQVKGKGSASSSQLAAKTRSQCSQAALVKK
ncbi:hypothetical protein R1flu_010307 [Riccia fluitans]|uniref:Uncharacterized protein n=1 Tax=Riccia fluitans TaxID=41844 RepID=A0ABD1Z4M0_9MARC